MPLEILRSSYQQSLKWSKLRNLVEMFLSYVCIYSEYDVWAVRRNNMLLEILEVKKWLVTYMFNVSLFPADRWGY